MMPPLTIIFCGIVRLADFSWGFFKINFNVLRSSSQIRQNIESKNEKKDWVATNLCNYS